MITKNTTSSPSNICKSHVIYIGCCNCIPVKSLTKFSMFLKISSIFDFVLQACGNEFTIRFNSLIDHILFQLTETIPRR